MNRIGRHTTSLALALLAVSCLLPASAIADKKYQKIKAPQLRDVVVPPVTRITLDNGLQLFVVEDHDLPLFRTTLVMKAGSAYDPAQKVGLAGLTAGVLRTGGSAKLAGDKMDEVLESMGGSIESEAGTLDTTVRINVLSGDAERALEMLRDLLLEPAYPEDKVDLEIKQTKSAIARRNDDPGDIADREMANVLYGKDHPFARDVEYEHLARISRQDLVDFHRAYYHPQDAALAVWGDFKAPEMVETVKRILGAWQKAEVKYPELPPVPETVASVNLATKESVNQSNIVIGHRGTTQKDPDYYSLVVMNEILGGSFGSRLFNEVRSRQGLAYRVGSGLGAGLQYPGMFMVRSGTKSETTLQATKACIEEVRKMKTQAITEDELVRAKEGILNSHVFNFTNKGAIVERQMRYVRNGYPADFLEKFPTAIQAVTVEDVKRASDKYLHPDQFAVLVVGKPADFDQPLSTLGTVNEIDITIPAPPVKEEFPAATPETLTKGKEILAGAATALGTPESMRKVQNLTETSTVTLTMMGQSIPGKMTRYQQYPGNVRSEIEIMGQKMVEVYSASANAGYQTAGGQSKDFEPNDIADAKEDQARDLLEILRNPNSYSPQWLGEADVNGKKADVLLLSPEGLPKFKVFVDRTTKHVVKMEYRGKSIQGAPVQEELFLTEYKKAGSLVLPHKATIMQDGQPFLAAQTVDFGWGPIPADKFKKPSS